MYSNPPPRPPGPPLFGPWHCVGVCALALGLGIFIAAVFPVGALMFLVAFLLIFCGIGCLRRFYKLVEKGMNIGRGKSMKIVVWKSPKVLSSLLRRVFGVREEA